MMLRRILLKTSGVITMQNRLMSRYQAPQFSRMKMTIKPKGSAIANSYKVVIENKDHVIKENDIDRYGRYGHLSNNYTTKIIFQKEDLDDKDELNLLVIMRKTNGTAEFIHLSIDTSKETNIVQWENGATKLDILTRIDKDQDVTLRDEKQLCRREEEFVTKRKSFVYNNMIKNRRLKTSLEGKDESVVPRIAILGSGGGLRATIGMSGALIGLKTLGILDYTMYTAGLSGSQWYLMALHTCDQTLDPKRIYNRIKRTLPRFGRMDMFRNKCKVWNKNYWFDVFNLKNELYIVDSIIGEQNDVTWSEQTQKLEEGSAPLLFITALLVRDESEIRDYHEWIELSPYEVYIPNIGAAIDMENLGDEFYGGFVTNEHIKRDCIGLLQGICCKGHAEVKNYKPSGGKWYQLCSVIKDWIRRKFNSRHQDVYGKMPNLLYGMKLIEPSINEIDFQTGILDGTNKNMHLVDASLVFNSPYPTILNPSKKVDVILSFDFSDRGQDTNWPFEELEKASEWAKQRQIPFPEVDSQLKEIRNNCSERGNFEEVYVFPGGDDSPTIVHFVMINQSFAHSGGPDFKILPKYATNRFFYSEEEIDNLSRLMMFNVHKNNEKILDAILSKFKKSE